MGDVPDPKPFQFSNMFQKTGRASEMQLHFKVRVTARVRQEGYLDAASLQS